VAPLLRLLNLYNLLFRVVSFKLKELVTTDTELKAMAAPAIIGLSRPKAAKGMPIILYINAQKRFCLIFLIVLLDSFMAVGIALKSPLIR